MLLNMTLAYFVRYNHFTWKRTGVYVLHSGLVVMMASEVITGLYAVEGQMAIDEGESSNVVVQNRYYELAITSPAEDNPTKYLDEVVIPASMLQKPGAPSATTPCRSTWTVDEYMKNSEPALSRRTTRRLAGHRGGRPAPRRRRPDEVSGTAKKQTPDMPSAYLTFKTKDGQTIGTYLMSLYLDPQPVKVGDKTYKVALRFKQTYRPYSIHLDKFSFDRWEGTQMARNFSSQVQRRRSRAGRRGPPVTHQDERPAALPRRDVLPAELRREDRANHGPAGGPQPRLAAAVHLVRAGRPGDDDPLRHAPVHLPLPPEGRLMDQLTRYFPYGVVVLRGHDG